MQETTFASLGDLERRSIMLLLPVPDLLQLSAACRRNRADLFRLMHGDLLVNISVCFLGVDRAELYMPADSRLREPACCREARARKASFRAFLQAGGAPLIKSLELYLEITHPLIRHCECSPLEPVVAWPPLQALESLALSCNFSPLAPGYAEAFSQVVASPIIATAGQLRELRLSFPSTCVFVSTMLERISGAVAAAGSGLKSVSIEVNAVPPNVEQQIYHQYLTFAIAPVAARHVSTLVTVAVKDNP